MVFSQHKAPLIRPSRSSFIVYAIIMAGRETQTDELRVIVETPEEAQRVVEEKKAQRLSM